MQLFYAVAIRLSRLGPVILGFISIGLFFFPVRTEIAALSPFSTHLIFFISGALFRKYFLDESSLKPSLVSILILLATLMGSGLFIFENLVDPVRLASSDHPFFFLYLAIIGILLCVKLAQYLAQKNVFPFLRILGLYSMQIYLAHMLAGVGARIVLTDIFHLQNWALNIVLSVLFALIAPIILQIISKNVKFFLFVRVPQKDWRACQDEMNEVLCIYLFCIFFRKALIGK